jgi:hypothetical protein
MHTGNCTLSQQNPPKRAKTPPTKKPTLSDRLFKFNLSRLRNGFPLSSLSLGARRAPHRITTSRITAAPCAVTART